MMAPSTYAATWAMHYLPVKPVQFSVRMRHLMLLELLRELFRLTRLIRLDLLVHRALWF